MKVYIKKIESIGHQDAFQKNNCWETLQPLTTDTQIIAPDFKEYIPAASLRRFSPVLRIAITAALACKNEKDFDAISVGTALGCLKDTEKFLQTFIQSASDTLSPTAFIQSTHNTIAGAISMALGNHAYNMTHTQNSLSFETALIDGLMCVQEGKTNVLVGAADEAIPFLELLRPTVIQSELPLTNGATFMVLSNETSEKALIDCAVEFNATNTTEKIEAFLAKNGVDSSQVELVLYAGECPTTIGDKQVNYEQYTGLYYSSSAFAVHLANDYSGKNGNYALIVNHQIPGKLGLTLVG